ncbi:hypothetical protein [Streptacidiphilus sp. EB103A]|uniref:ATP-binding protein n=1 Tax=Streptacidiphilus sp. EB103A TaxID=3156275 RepID=UPI0035167579
MLIPDALGVALTAGTAGSLVTVPWLITARRRAARAERARSTAEADARSLTDQLSAANTEAASRLATLTAVAEENRHLVTTRLPARISQLAHPHVPVPPLLHHQFADSDLDLQHRAVLDQVGSAVVNERIRVDEAAQDILRGTAAGARTLSQQIQKILIQAQNDFEDPDVLQTLLDLDHLNERIKRLWQLLAIVCGDTTGLSLMDTHLEDLVAGAQARLDAYQLIKPVNNLDARQRLGVAAHAAEPVAVILAELMANATFFSTGTVPVSVEIHQTATGALVIIDDAGPGMHPEDQAFVAKAVSERWRVLLTELGSPPRLGFAGIGRLLREFPITLQMSVSQYGGVHAAVHIPNDLLVQISPQHPVSAAAALPVGLLREQAHVVTPQSVLDPPSTAAGLPRRSRQQPDPAPGPTSGPTPQPRSPEQVRDRYAHLQQATRQGRGNTDESASTAPYGGSPS